MFPVYSVTYVPGPYPVLRSLALLDVLQGVRLRGPRSQALPGRRLRRLAATGREKCGLAAGRCDEIGFKQADTASCGAGNPQLAARGQGAS